MKTYNVLEVYWCAMLDYFEREETTCVENGDKVGEDTLYAHLVTLSDTWADYLHLSPRGEV